MRHRPPPQTPDKIRELLEDTIRYYVEEAGDLLPPIGDPYEIETMRLHAAVAFGGDVPEALAAVWAAFHADFPDD